MGTRSLALLSFIATAFTLAPSARADVPNPSTGSGTSSGSTATDCTVDERQQQGRTCQTCNPATTCTTLGSDCSMACEQSATVQVWCNGPNPNVAADQNVAGCSIVAPGACTGAAVGGALAVAAALLMRRRRRG